MSRLCSALSATRNDAIYTTAYRFCAFTETLFFNVAAGVELLDVCP
jgi:hypothetical protein